MSYSICLRACKICVVFVVELNVKVIPVKYGRELTLHKLESNISTKQLQASTTRNQIQKFLIKVLIKKNKNLK